MRLIDADALKEKSRRCFVDGFHGSGIYGEMDIVLTTDISTAPTVDAAPVVHGRLEHTHGGGYFKVTCTACGVAVMKGNTELFGIPTVGWAYCPSCGATMDRKDDT